MRWLSLFAGALLPIVAAAQVARLPGRWMGGVRAGSLGAALAVVFLQLLPEAGAALGGVALLGVALGLVLPLFLERWMARLGTAGPAVAGRGRDLVLLGLILHQAVHGFEIGAAHRMGNALGVTLAVGLHSLPLVALVLLTRTRRTMRFGTLALCVGTSAGLAAGLWIPALTGFHSGWLPALMAGVMLHVLGHDLESGAPTTTRGRRRELLAFAAALALTTVALDDELLGGVGVEVAQADEGMDEHALHSHSAEQHFSPYEHPDFLRLYGREAGRAPTEDGHEADALAPHRHRLPGARVFSLALLEQTRRVSPLLLLGLALGAALQLRHDRIQGGLIAGRGGALRAPLLALTRPLSAGALVPIAEGLAEQQARPPLVVGLLTGAPALGLPAVLVSFGLLGAPLASARLGLALVLAWASGALAGWGAAPGPAPAPSDLPLGDLNHDHARRRQEQRAAARHAHGHLGPHAHGHDHEGEHHHGAHPEPAPHAHRAPPPWRVRWLRTLDENTLYLGAWLLMGLLLATSLDLFLPAALVRVAWLPWLILLVWPLPIPLAALLPIAAVLIERGAPVGLVLAPLLLGPAVHSASIKLIDQRYGRRSAVGATAAALVVAAGLPLLPLEGTALARSVGWFWLPSWLEAVSAALLGLLLLRSLARVGPRTWFAELLAGGGHDHAAHEHDFGHHHHAA